MMTKKYTLEGLDCANCGSKIERKIAKIKGIEDSNVDFLTCKLIVDARSFDDSLCNEIFKVIYKVDNNINIVEL